MTEALDERVKTHGDSEWKFLEHSKKLCCCLYQFLYGT